MNSDFYTTQLSPEVHLLPGIGFIEYLYDAPKKHLTINIGDNEVRVIEGAEARRIYFEIVGMNEDIDPIVAQLNAACLRAWNMPFSAFSEKTRKEDVKDRRQIMMWWLRIKTDMSYREIGIYFGGYDHTTVLHAVNRIEEMMFTDESIKYNLNLFQTAIKQL